MSYYCLVVDEGLVHVQEDYNFSDVDRTNFLREPDTDCILKFDSKREAQTYLNEKIKPEYIHPSWVNPDLDQKKLFK